MKILFVDDEPDHEQLVRQFLEMRPDLAGHTYFFAMDGAQALEKLQLDPEIEIVFSDLRMPRMDGLTLISAVLAQFPQVASVIVSAYGDLKNIRSAMNRGAFDFLIKPIDMDDFHVTIDRTIKHVEKQRADRIEREKLNAEIIESQKEIIWKLSELIEVKSQETGNHVRRVSEYCRLLALHSGLGPEEADVLRLAAPMHDIGKVAIPDAILHKPGKLTDEEWVVMRAHAVIGYNLFKDSTRPFLKCAAIIAHEHHEKFDGSGYPRGLKGTDINIYGRIMAIADVFDALCSRRAYKEPWPLEKVMSTMQEQKGRHFDPALVDVMMSRIDEYLEVRRSLPDEGDAHH